MQGLAFVSSVHEGYVVDFCFLCLVVVAREVEPLPEMTSFEVWPILGS